MSPDPNADHDAQMDGATADGCSDCGDPLGPYNMTGVCKACQRERDQEKADLAAEVIRKLDQAGIWEKP